MKTVFFFLFCFVLTSCKKELLPNILCGEQSAYYAQETSDGGFIVLGKNLCRSNHEIYLLKINSDGEKEWMGLFGEENEKCYKLRETKEGYVLFGNNGYLGTSFSPSGISNQQVTTTRLFVLNVSHTGSTIDKHNHTLGHNVYFRDITTINDDNYVIIGYQKSYLSGEEENVLAHIHKHGSLIWSKQMGIKQRKTIKKIKRLDDGDYIICGSSDNQETFLSKYDKSGNQTWTKTYQIGSESVGISMEVVNDGNIVIFGRQKDYDGLYHTYFLKTNTNGDSLLTSIITPNTMTNEGLCKNGKNDLFLLTNSPSPKIYKIDQNGIVIKTITLSDENNLIRGRCIQPTSNNGLILSGYMSNDQGIEKKIYISRLDESGTVVWSKTY